MWGGARPWAQPRSPGLGGGPEAVASGRLGPGRPSGEELCHSATVQMGTRPEGRQSAPWGLWGPARIRRLPCPPPAPPPSIFGHISFRSDWELVKVDFRPSFSRPCGEEDYSSWDLTNLQVGAGRPTSAWGPCPGGHGSPREPLLPAPVPQKSSQNRPPGGFWPLLGTRAALGSLSGDTRPQAPAQPRAQIQDDSGCRNVAWAHVSYVA